MLVTGAEACCALAGSEPLVCFYAAVWATLPRFPPVGGGPLGGAPGLDAIVGGLPVGALTGGANVTCLVSGWFFQSSPWEICYVSKVATVVPRVITGCLKFLT